MTNHPNRNSYNQLIAALERISVNNDLASDVRRLARDEYMAMSAANQKHGHLPSSASYFNRFGARADEVERADRKQLEAERADRMMRARASAERFLGAWGLSR